MFILYIDDSFFGHSEFSRDMRYKLRVLLQESFIREVWISNARTQSDVIARFFQEWEDVHYQESTKRIQVEEKEWILSNTSLQCGEVCIRPFSGTYCLVDTETSHYERIYLDLFPQEETDLVSIFMETIQNTIERLTGTDEKMKS